MPPPIAHITRRTRRYNLCMNSSGSASRSCLACPQRRQQARASARSIRSPDSSACCLSGCQPAHQVNHPINPALAYQPNANTSLSLPSIHPITARAASLHQRLLLHQICDFACQAVHTLNNAATPALTRGGALPVTTAHPSACCCSSPSTARRLRFIQGILTIYSSPV